MLATLAGTAALEKSTEVKSHSLICPSAVTYTTRLSSRRYSSSRGGNYSRVRPPSSLRTVSPPARIHHW